MTPSGTEPATFLLVAQCLNQLLPRAPDLYNIYLYDIRKQTIYIRRAQVKVGLINLFKGLFSLNARIYYKLKNGT
jgi:hypothetical protein